MQTVPKTIWKNPIHFVACGFGAGAVPWAPGTFGTLVGVLLYLMLSELSLGLYIVITIILFVIGVFICDKTSHDFGVADHSAIVWDEMIGFLIVMIAVPKTWYFILIGFLFFRLFDIWKPWPIRWVDRQVSGGFGIMLDDVVAAVFAWVVLQILAVFMR